MLQSKTNIIIVDFHAEATSEKQAMRHFLDGKVSVLFGTHTHVLTADERVLPGGTAYISDAGYSGALDSALGVEYGVILERFLKQMPVHFKVEDKGSMILSGIKVDIDTKTGKALSIERVVIEDRDLKI
jgi:calcineurin-like phosphoesterase